MSFSLFLGRVGNDYIGHSKLVNFRYVGPASYTAGGETIAPASIGLGTVEWIWNQLGGIYVLNTSIVIYGWNPATLKLQAFWGNAGSAGVLPEVTNGTPLNVYVASLMAYGKG